MKHDKNAVTTTSIWYLKEYLYRIGSHVKYFKLIITICNSLIIYSVNIKYIISMYFK